MVSKHVFDNDGYENMQSQKENGVFKHTRHHNLLDAT